MGRAKPPGKFDGEGFTGFHGFAFPKELAPSERNRSWRKEPFLYCPCPLVERCFKKVGQPEIVSHSNRGVWEAMCADKEEIPVVEEAPVGVG